MKRSGRIIEKGAPRSCVCDALDVGCGFDITKPGPCLVSAVSHIQAGPFAVVWELGNAGKALVFGAPLRARACEGKGLLAACCLVLLRDIPDTPKHIRRHAGAFACRNHLYYKTPGAPR